MRVRIIQHAGYGTHDGIMHDVNSVIELEDDVALKLIRYGMVVAEPEIETAEVAPPENAAKRTRKPRPRK